MIPSREAYEQTLSEIARMVRIIEAIRVEIVPFDQEDFEFAAAAPMAAVMRMREEADDFLRRSTNELSPALVGDST